MTKKSASRIARDKAGKELESMTWDELNANYKKCTEYFAAIGVNLRTAMLSPFRFYMTVPECERAGVMLKQLGADMTKLKGELDRLYQLHAHKTGKVDMMDQELWDCISTFEAYEAWRTRIQANIIPLMNDLAEEYAKGEMRMNAWLGSGRAPVEKHQAWINQQAAENKAANEALADTVQVLLPETQSEPAPVVMPETETVH